MNPYGGVMAIIKYGHRDLDVACRLDVAEGRDRLTAWRLLRGEEGLGSEQLPNGVRIWLRPGARGRASELARQEARCCGFLDLELASDGDHEERGLIRPLGRQSGHRRFSPSAARRLRAITAAREAGFSLEQIRDLLDSQAEGSGDWRGLVEGRIAEVRARIERLEHVAQALAGDARAMGRRHVLGRSHAPQRPGEARALPPHQPGHEHRHRWLGRGIVHRDLAPVTIEFVRQPLRGAGQPPGEERGGRLRAFDALATQALRQMRVPGGSGNRKLRLRLQPGQRHLGITGRVCGVGERPEGAPRLAAHRVVEHGTAGAQPGSQPPQRHTQIVQRLGVRRDEAGMRRPHVMEQRPPDHPGGAPGGLGQQLGSQLRQ
ncbi:MAG: hypothetical protein B7Z74_08120 [Deltaproteobacteria bacterium 21-66-5]|nr:MAG: hypothetical protein B7Z74_08120 [Deltaproteobacteria bacterium 21-66-5]